MSMDETSARRVILVQAIETADREGKLIGEAERAQIDRQARQAAQAASVPGRPAAVEQFIDLRAQRVLQVLSERSPAIVALKDAPLSRRWLLVGTPLVTLLMGALTERIADPHRVDLLSLPLLAIVGWNLAVYLLLLARWLLPNRQRARPALQALGRWVDEVREWRRGSGDVFADATTLFFQRWHRLGTSIQLQRAAGLLHLAALGWGAGVAASLMVQGLVVQYRVGWESTFLEASQVHSILSVLLLPVVSLFPFEPFTVQEVAALQLGPGTTGQADPRWVWMYAALLLLVVILPRAGLAAVALGRAASRARHVPVDLADPYFQRLVSLLTPAQVQLCLVSHRAEDRQTLLRLLVQQPDAARLLISTPDGDTLRWEELAGSQAPAQVPPEARSGWMERLLQRVRPTQAAQLPVLSAPPQLWAARADTDVVLHVAGAAADLPQAAALLEWIGKPVLVLVNRPHAAESEPPGLVARCEAQAKGVSLVERVMSFDAFARCWVQEHHLFDAIGRCLQPAKRPGFARISAAWGARNEDRFGRSMAALAQHLVYAARQVQEVPSVALSMKSLVSAGERQAQANARQQAMDAVTGRLEASAAQMFAHLLALHGIDDENAGVMQHRMQEKFLVQQAVDAPQAGIAGAATGAAMGASVDLLVGGLTLGAAAALGALVGGSAGFIAAAWRNRTTANGATVVQLSDEMMEAMLEGALLLYLAVAHYGRGPAGAETELRAAWKSDVAAVVAMRSDWLAPFWAAVRTRPDEGQAAALARELEAMARTILQRLYPR
jgi:hypothetical protein